MDERKELEEYAEVLARQTDDLEARTERIAADHAKLVEYKSKLKHAETQMLQEYEQKSQAIQHRELLLMQKEQELSEMVEEMIQRQRDTEKKAEKLKKMEKDLASRIEDKQTQMVKTVGDQKQIKEREQKVEELEKDLQKREAEMKNTMEMLRKKHALIEKSANFLQEQSAEISKRNEDLQKLEAELLAAQTRFQEETARKMKEGEGLSKELISRANTLTERERQLLEQAKKIDQEAELLQTRELELSQLEQDLHQRERHIVDSEELLHEESVTPTRNLNEELLSKAQELSERESQILEQAKTVDRKRLQALHQQEKIVAGEQMLIQGLEVSNEAGESIKEESVSTNAEVLQTREIQIAQLEKSLQERESKLAEREQLTPQVTVTPGGMDDDLLNEELISRAKALSEREKQFLEQQKHIGLWEEKLETNQKIIDRQKSVLSEREELLKQENEVLKKKEASLSKREASVKEKEEVLRKKEHQMKMQNQLNLGKNAWADLKSGKKKSANADRALLLTKKEQRLIAREKALENKEKAAFGIRTSDSTAQALIREQENQIKDLKRQVSELRLQQISGRDNVNTKEASEFHKKVRKIENALRSHGIRADLEEDASEKGLILVRKDQLNKLNIFADSLSSLEIDLSKQKKVSRAFWKGQLHPIF